jgi:hypothetical protein
MKNDKWIIIETQPDGNKNYIVPFDDQTTIDVFILQQIVYPDWEIVKLENYNDY